MNSGATTDRVYAALKRRVMNHEFRPGARLDPAVLAGSLSSSVTPVRDALHMLAGEGLVEARVSDGFHLPAVDEPGLKDLYAWMNEVLSLALQGRVSGRTTVDAPEAAPLGTAAERAADLFARIGAQSSNTEHERAIRALNARLHPLRVVEPHVLKDIEEEVQAIAECVAAGDVADARRLIRTYHRRRKRSAAAIVRALYRAE